MGCQRIRGSLCAHSCQRRRTVFGHQISVSAQSSVAFSGGVRTVAFRDMMLRLSSHVYSAASSSLPRFFLARPEQRPSHRFCCHSSSPSHHIPGSRPTRRRILRCSQLIGTSVRFARPSSTANGRILGGHWTCPASSHSHGHMAVGMLRSQQSLLGTRNSIKSTHASVLNQYNVLFLPDSPSA